MGDSRASRANMGKMTDKEIAECKEAFDLFDADNGGTIDIAELGTAMEALGFTPQKGEVQKMVSDMDKDGDGTIDFDEFMQLMGAKVVSCLPNLMCHLICVSRKL